MNEQGKLNETKAQDKYFVTNLILYLVSKCYSSIVYNYLEIKYIRTFISLVLYLDCLVCLAVSICDRQSRGLEFNPQVEPSIIGFSHKEILLAARNITVL